MTDIELLPLPSKVQVDKHWPSGVAIYGYTHDMMRDYARANVAHAIATKDAEIAELLDDGDDLLARLDASIDHGTKLGAAMQRCLDEVLEQKDEIETLRAEVEGLRSLCVAAYQMAGVHDAPVEWLDALSNAASGRKFSIDGLLPYMPDAVCEAEARAKRLAEALRGVLPFVVSDVLEHCDGNKCREQWCAGCMGDEYAAEQVERARAAAQAARDALEQEVGNG